MRPELVARATTGRSVTGRRRHRSAVGQISKWSKCIPALMAVLRCCPAIELRRAKRHPLDVNTSCLTYFHFRRKRLTQSFMHISYLYGNIIADP